MDQNELPADQCHLEVPLGVPKKIAMPMAHSMQNRAPILRLD
jgi:hypothetical protein